MVMHMLLQYHLISIIAMSETTSATLLHSILCFHSTFTTEQVDSDFVRSAFQWIMYTLVLLGFFYSFGKSFVV